MIIRYALIAGIITSALMMGSIIYCYNTGKFEGNMVLGFAFMLLGFSLIFVGVKTQRDKFLGGTISFGQAFKTGLLMAFIASTIYVITWMICYYFFVPDFMEKFTAHALEKLQASGKSAAEIAEKTAEMSWMKEKYNNPLFIILFTYVEILPLGILVSLIVALLLKRKNR